jgi:steroid delta-isomerase-like uncharacterized protein
MNTEANKATVHQFLDAWQRGDTDTLKRLLADDAITHISATNQLQSQEFEPQSCASWVAAFPDTVLTVERLVAEGDEVAAYWTIRATHQAPFMDMEATGKQVQFGGLEINRIQDGKIVEIWRLSDTMTLMQQLGAM